MGPLDEEHGSLSDQSMNQGMPTSLVKLTEIMSQYYSVNNVLALWHNTAWDVLTVEWPSEFRPDYV